MPIAAMTTPSEQDGHGYAAVLAWIRYIWRQCPRVDRWGLGLAFAITVSAVALLAVAPLFFARMLDDAATGAVSAGTVAASMGAFLGLRFLGQAMVDLRWTTVNPLLYRICYRYSLDIGRIIADREGRTNERVNRVAEVSHSVVVIEKAQTSLMALTFHLTVFIIPVVFEVLVMLAVTALVLGPVSPFVMLGAVAASGASIQILRTQEARTLQKALEADNAVFREIGQQIGFAPLIREFKATAFFRSRMSSRIDPSLTAHSRHFKVKTLRALARTGVTAVCYVAVLGIVSLQNGFDAVRPGDLFLVLAYLDRLATPIANLAVASVAVENALVGLHGATKLLAPPAGDGTPTTRVIRDTDQIRIETNYPGWPAQGLVVPFGSRILVSGRSGAGKSSLLEQIRAAVDRESSGLSGYYLPEKPLIVEGDVRANLTFAETGSKAADNWAWFWKTLGTRQSPGLDQAADQLSAGETQLLAFVRVLDRRPDVLFIDEGLSAMDAVMETTVVETSDRFLDGSILFLVSHRPIASFRPDIHIAVADRTVRAITPAAGGSKAPPSAQHLIGDV